MSNHSSNDNRLLNKEAHGSIPKELPLVLRVEDLTQMLSIGRNTAYALVRSGEIRSIRIGKSYRIPKEAIEEYISKHQASP